MLKSKAFEKCLLSLTTNSENQEKVPHFVRRIFGFLAKKCSMQLFFGCYCKYVEDLTNLGENNLRGITAIIKCIHRQSDLTEDRSSIPENHCELMGIYLILQ